MMVCTNTEQMRPTMRAQDVVAGGIASYYDLQPGDIVAGDTSVSKHISPNRRGLIRTTFSAWPLDFAA
jgi:hypothetical protein